MRRHASMLAGALLPGLLALTAPCGADAPKAEEGFTPLFNGKDLTGWRYKGSKESLGGKTQTSDGRIAVEGGVIVMREKDARGRGGIKDLYTLKDFPRPFHLKLQFRASLKADSGVYVRGPQLQVRDFIRRGEYRHLRKFKNDGWNDLDVVVRNNVVSVNGRPLGPKDSFELTVKGGTPHATLNGKEVGVHNVTLGAVAVCTCNGERLEVMRNIPATGGIGLQAETGRFEFRNIRVKELE